MKRLILVTGGAGYIGSHMAKMLAQAGHEVVVFDNLSRGHRDAVLCGDFVCGDLRDGEDLRRVFSQYPIDIVMHFAALAYVGESISNPREYYRNNLVGSLNLLDAMIENGVNKIVFSSTCATYGVQDVMPITEEASQRPINPYGKAKLAVEYALTDYAHTYGIDSISLRYFNAAGCDFDGQLGERHDPETHLIPLVLQEAVRLIRGGDPEATQFQVFGSDFPTPDGTCVRDYIHVTDLCVAHLAALDRLFALPGIGAEAYNLGNGKGFSVKQVIETVREVTGADIRYTVSARRPGDPPILVGSAEKALQILRWRAQYTELPTIIESAWKWFSSIDRASK
jgi:UDP-glucose-4-epimerase GalE